MVPSTPGVQPAAICKHGELPRKTTDDILYMSGSKSQSPSSKLEPKQSSADFLAFSRDMARCSRTSASPIGCRRRGPKLQRGWSRNYLLVIPMNLPKGYGWPALQPNPWAVRPPASQRGPRRPAIDGRVGHRLPRRHHAASLVKGTHWGLDHSLALWKDLRYNGEQAGRNEARAGKYHTKDQHPLSSIDQPGAWCGGQVALHRMRQCH